MITIHRTGSITESRRGRARRLIVVTRNLVFPAIENADDEDQIPAGEHSLVMTKMARARLHAFWLRGTELFVHSANHPVQLKGCIAPGLTMTRDGVASSQAAMAALIMDVSPRGFVDGLEIPTIVIDC